MIFNKIRKFFIREESAENYLDMYFNKTIDNLNAGLNALKFSDNFNSHVEADLVIAAGAEAEIVHKLGAIPTHRIITRFSGTGGPVSDGSTAWTNTKVYLKNEGGASVTITVIFFK